MHVGVSNAHILNRLSIILCIALHVLSPRFVHQAAVENHTSTALENHMSTTLCLHCDIVAAAFHQLLKECSTCLSYPPRFVRQTAEVKNHMTALELLVEYTSL